jgi:hypothetical protein
MVKIDGFLIFILLRQARDSEKLDVILKAKEHNFKYCCNNNSNIVVYEEY